jgi:hypothetical protein
MLGQRKNMNKIKFINTSDDVSDIFAPIPASKSLPDWYKKMPSYMNGIKEITSDGTTGTIKKCLPVFDAISNGYLILTHCDISIKWDDIGYVFDAPHDNFKFISHHPLWQVNLHPKIGSDLTNVPKYASPWGIVTPKGYSSLFVPPIHRENDITIFEGVVDTDSYHSPVQLPFYLNKSETDLFIPAGTPIAQVIVFKRESWKSEINKDYNKTIQTKALNNSRFFDAYKNLFWSRKKYE